jgi:PAS domain S-box-containing protein
MHEEISSSPSPAIRRWTRTLADLRLRASRRPRRPDVEAVPFENVADDALDLCQTLLQQTAAAELEGRRSMAAVRREREIRQHLFDKLPIASVTTDAAGYIRSANRAAALLLGMSASALRGRLFLLFAEDRAGFHDLLRTPDGRTHYATLTIRPRELRPLKVQVTIAPDEPGDASGWVWFLQPSDRCAPAPTTDAP